MSKAQFEGSWHVPVAVSDVPNAGQHLELAANADVRAAITKAAGLRGLPHLAASFDLRPHGAEGLHVVGQVRGRVEQTCVVTLEPVESEIIEDIDLVFLPPGASPEQGGSSGGDDEDETEALVNGTVDLGAIATEFLILGLDPYPRRSGVEFEAPANHEAGGSAFAALAALKASLGDKGGK